MEDATYILLEKLYSEFKEFKSEVNDKVNDLLNKEDKDYLIFEDIMCKLQEISKILEKNNSDSKLQEQKIIDTIGEKIAMLMLRNF
jgi:hypothetical protein